MTSAERWDKFPEVLTLKDVEVITGLERRAAMKMLRIKSCPTLPRKRNETYKVPKAAFASWLENY